MISGRRPLKFPLTADAEWEICLLLRVLRKCSICISLTFSHESLKVRKPKQITVTPKLTVLTSWALITKLRKIFCCTLSSFVFLFKLASIHVEIKHPDCFVCTDLETYWRILLFHLHLWILSCFICTASDVFHKITKDTFKETLIVYVNLNINIWLHIEILLCLIANIAHLSDFYFRDFIVIEAINNTLNLKLRKLEINQKKYIYNIAQKRYCS